MPKEQHLIMFPRPSYIILILSLLFAVIVIKITDPAPVRALRHATFSTFQSFIPRQPADTSPVQIIDIDQESLDKIGSWPWPRTHLAKLVRELRKNNAAAVGLPLILKNSDPLSPDNIARQLPGHVQGRLQRLLENIPQNDQVLSQILKKSPVIMGFTPLASTENGQALSSPYPLPSRPNAGLKISSFLSVRQSLPLLTTQAKGIGGLPVLDGFGQSIQELPMIYRNGQELYPSFTAEMLRIAQGATQYGILANSNNSVIQGLKIGDIDLPLNPSGKLLFHARKTDKSRYLPAWKILRDGADASQVEGRLVIIGSTIPQIMPAFPTALENNISQAELIAQSLEQILQKRFLLRPTYSTYIETGLFIVGTLFILFGLFYLGSMVTALLTGLFIALFTALSLYLFQSRGLLTDPVFPALSLGLVYLAGRYSHLIPAGQARDTIQNIFAGKLPEKTIQKMTQTSTSPILEGKFAIVPMLTMQFSGLEGLDPKSHSPETLAPLVRDIYANSREIIYQGGGLLEHQGGDHLRAIWEQPCKDQYNFRPDDLKAVCKTAQLMSRRHSQALLDYPAGRQVKNAPIPRCHIILSTGLNWIGDCAPDNNHNYSLFGSANMEMNQLSTIACHYNARILATQVYAEKVTDIPFLPFPVPQQSCTSQEEYIYIMLDTQDGHNAKTFNILENLHFRLLESLREGNSETVKTLIDQCLPLAGKDLAQAYTQLKRYI